MIHTVRFMSLDQARKLTPNRETLMVSILDLEERQAHRLPRLAGYRSVLSLNFEDTAEEGKLAEPGSWPDEPSDDEHARFAQRRGERVPTLVDANRILEFAKAHHGSDERLSMVVHCKAGVSRSAAVAKWVIDFTGADLCDTVRMSTERANPRLLRLLDTALSLAATPTRKIRP